MKIGGMVQQGWKTAAKENGIDIHVSGIAPLGHFEFKHEKPLVLKTIFSQLMLEKGFLATNAFYASFAHKKEDVDKYIKAVNSSFGCIVDLIKNGSPEKYLKGPVCHSGFKRLN